MPDKDLISEQLLQRLFVGFGPGSAWRLARRVNSEPVGFGLWAHKLIQAPHPTEPSKTPINHYSLTNTELQAMNYTAIIEYCKNTGLYVGYVPSV